MCHQETLGSGVYVHFLIAVVILQVESYSEYCQIAHFNYVKFIQYQLYLNNTVWMVHDSVLCLFFFFFFFPISKRQTCKSENVNRLNNIKLRKQLVKNMCFVLLTWISWTSFSLDSGKRPVFIKHLKYNPWT